MAIFTIPTMSITFVYRTADIYLSKLRESAEISAVRYTNMNVIVVFPKNLHMSRKKEINVTFVNSRLKVKLKNLHKEPRK